MKVVFVNNGMTHYYNLVLSRLNALKEVDLTLVVPVNLSQHIGDGVYQTEEGASFRVLRLRECVRFGIYTSLKGLARLLLREKPEVVIATDAYVYAFMLDLPVLLVMKTLNIRFILKSIPFRLPRYDESKAILSKELRPFRGFPLALNDWLRFTGLARLIRSLELPVRKLAFNLPDAHVNYVDDAFDIYGSYGVPRNKIFVTRNSPDTDHLFAVKASLAGRDPILPPSEHRIIHVGRLVEWKRVDLLLRAFVRVKRMFPDAELVVIGSGPQMEPLKAQSIELGLNGSVAFIGGVYDPAVLGRYFMASSVYVLAGMGGLSINEAMCFGLPVICSVCDGTEKALVRDGYNGRYFSSNDGADLADKLIEVLDNPELRKRMGENSLKIIREEININTVVSEYCRALKYTIT